MVYIRTQFLANMTKTVYCNNAFVLNKQNNKMKFGTVSSNNFDLFYIVLIISFQKEPTELILEIRYPTEYSLIS